jgi:glycosyltransferase involved in cell wall biosynthesis
MAAIKPLLLISDSVSAPTGFGRIARDLAIGIHKNLSDIYRLATFGFGAPMDCSLCFPQITAENTDEFILPTLPEAWNGFAGNEKGIIFTIWDASRLGWLGTPTTSQKLTKYPALMKWLEKAPFEKWLYCPIDASGPNDRLTFPLMKTLYGFDRIIAYSEWGRSIIEATISTETAQAKKLCALPHGLHSDIFFQSPDRQFARFLFPVLTRSTSIVTERKAIAEDEVLIGIVATNQTRKNWPLGIETAAILADKGMNVRLWIHTDTLNRNWDIISLLIDHGMLGERTLISSGYLSDEEMADAYSACDVTLGIGPEGFGFPIFESMFCGTPCVHGNYGGAPEHLPKEYLVEPYGFYIDGIYSQKRPVYHAEDFAKAVEGVVGQRAVPPAHLDWKNLWPRWEAWFREGVGDERK